MLFDLFKYKNPLEFLKLTEEMAERVKTLKIHNEIVVGYSFHNIDECALFVNAFREKRPIVISLDSDRYLYFVAKGFELVQKNNYRRALHIFLTSLNI